MTDAASTHCPPPPVPPAPVPSAPVQTITGNAAFKSYTTLVGDSPEALDAQVTDAIAQGRRALIGGLSAVVTPTGIKLAQAVGKFAVQPDPLPSGGVYQTLLANSPDHLDSLVSAAILDGEMQPAGTMIFLVTGQGLRFAQAVVKTAAAAPPPEAAAQSTADETSAGDQASQTETGAGQASQTAGQGSETSEADKLASDIEAAGGSASASASSSGSSTEPDPKATKPKGRGGRHE